MPADVHVVTGTSRKRHGMRGCIRATSWRKKGFEARTAKSKTIGGSPGSACRPFVLSRATLDTQGGEWGRRAGAFRGRTKAQLRFLQRPQSFWRGLEGQPAPQRGI